MASCRSCSTDMLAVAEVPKGVNGRADPEDAEDLDSGRAFGPKRKVASCVAAAGIVGVAGTWVEEVQVG